jgi:hypothetical protein
LTTIATIDADKRNHTAAEAFLRGAGVGVRECTCPERWLGPTSYTMVSDGFCERIPGLADALHARLPPGQYALQYREGMQLTAAEAWDYLAGGEQRRCRNAAGGTLVRAREGVAERLFDDKWAPCRDDMLQGSDYTVAPDEADAPDSGPTPLDAQMGVARAARGGQPIGRRGDAPDASELGDALSRWIPVAERLPEEGALVPVRIDSGDKYAYLDHAEYCEVGEERAEYAWLIAGFSVEGEVTHWYDVPDYPEPAPEPRRLTFGEACEEPGTWTASVSGVEYEMRDGRVCLGGCSETYASVTRKLLAAEWVAK